MRLTNTERQSVIRAARRWLGTPYAYRPVDSAWRDLSATPASFDSSTFICRVAMEALGYGPETLVSDARWLIDHLTMVESPGLGDLVCYGREPSVYGVTDDVEPRWNVMLYVGNGLVIGACDIAGAVTSRPIDYGAQRWRLIDDPVSPFRTLKLQTPA